MKVHKLTQQHIDQIAELYEKYCGNPSNVLCIKQETVERIKALVMSGNASWRIGSRWDAQSKLNINLVKDNEIDVEFRPNFDPKDRKRTEYQAALRAAVEFRDAVRSQIFKEVEDA